jgi:hypothetical protein
MKPGRFTQIIWFLEIIPKLGIRNVLYVAYYRMLLKSGRAIRQNPVLEFADEGPVFTPCPVREDYPDAWKKPLLEQADHIIGGRLPYYSYHWMKQTTPPNWFLNPFNGKQSPTGGMHWSRIPDFSEETGDIKNVWEASRFSWVGILARAYAVSGKNVYLENLNRWLADWMARNPVNQGPNWKCGQETSYRLLALLNAAFILDQSEQPTAMLRTLIRLHLKRIHYSRRYAYAQRNNHASTEAAALFTGGNWLLKVRDSDPARHRTYAAQGRKALESLIRTLSYADGSFSQHSVVYHRLFLDTISSVIFWTRTLRLPEFSADFYGHARKAFHWLHALVDESGDAPNLGSNDGTLLQGNHACDYRDFRPSLQWASAWLGEQPVFGEGPYNEVLYWSGIRDFAEDPRPPQLSSEVFPSGYVVMKGRTSWALLRFPGYKFRPAHNDALHFDLWAEGRNLLFDSGSYSYNPDKDSPIPDLKSVHAHNTLSFDGQEQMPRLGRFLLARWLKPASVGKIQPGADGSGAWEGSYRDPAGNLHARRITWKDRQWEVSDRFSGPARKVEAGFNFEDGPYELDRNANVLQLSWGRITVSDHADLAVKDHWVSPYYVQSVACKRLIVSIPNNSELTCTINIHE